MSRSLLLALVAFGALALSAGEVKLISIADPAQLSDSAGGESGLIDRPQGRISGDGRFVVFVSSSENLVAIDGNDLGDIFVYDRFSETVSLISVDASGLHSGNGLSRDPVISRNGRFVAFVSEANNLVAGGVDANDKTDVYIRDLQSQTTALISINAIGSASGNGASDLPAISDDGRFVAFESLASNLDSGIIPDNAAKDVFVRDRLNGVTKTCSTSTVAGTAAAGTSSGAAISGDGSRVVFYSAAPNIVATGDTNGTTDIYAYKVSDGTKQLVSAVNGSTANSGRTGGHTQGLLHVSQDGGYATFVTGMSLTAMASDDTGTADDIYRRDLNGTITLLVTHKDGAAISAGLKIAHMNCTFNANFVAFTSQSQTLVTSVSYPSTAPNCFRADLNGGVSLISLVSGTASTAGNTSGSDGVSISDNGNLVVFDSFSTNLVSGVLSSSQILLRDMLAGTFTLISVRSDDQTSGNGQAVLPAISADGKFIAFNCTSNNLIVGTADINGNPDVFLRDVEGAKTALVTTRNPDTATISGGGNSTLNNRARSHNTSADGRYVVFTSSAPNLVASAADKNSGNDVFLRDTASGTTECMSVDPSGQSTGNNASSNAFISSDGRYVVFQSFATDLVAGPLVTSGIHLYARDRELQQTVLVTVNALGGASSGVSSTLLDISLNGTCILFSSTASDFVTAGLDSNGVVDLFVRDILSKTTTLISRDALGNAANGASSFGKISGDGTRVVFESVATSLLPGVTDSNGVSDVFLRDIGISKTVLLSPAITSTATTANGSSSGAQISADGQWVAFNSLATNIVIDPIPATTPAVVSRVFARSLAGNMTKLACQTLNTDFSQGSATLMSIDNTGTKVLFASDATDLVVVPDKNNGRDLFVFDTATNAISLVTINASGTESAFLPIAVNGNFYDQASLSGDGRWVSFLSDAADMVVAGVDVNAFMDVFVRDLQNNQTRAISLSRNGFSTGNLSAFQCCISLAGNAVIFSSNGSNHVNGDSNAFLDVFALALDNLPTFTPLPPVSVLEDAPPTVINLDLYFSDVESPDLTYVVANNTNPGLFSSVSFGKGGITLSLSYAPNAFGAAALTIRAMDNAGLSVDAVLNVTVTGVNDVPSFTKGADVTTTEAATVNTVAGWATNLTLGPVNENTQSVSAFVLSADQPQLFSVQPAVAANGTLTFTPAGNLNEPATVIVTVQLKDNGGTLNSGVDTSAAQTFWINLTPVADTLIVLNRNDVGANSLRDCLNRARKGDSVLFDPVVFDPANSDAATVIDVLSELPAMDDGGVTLDATGRRVTLNGGAAGSSSGLVISAAGNTVRGLNIIAFNRAGMVLQGSAANNVIGGSRLVGGGPNGQGLRISGNGSAGLDLKGVGVTGNVVKGCWIGLDAAGTGAQANLTGVLIEGGAAGNTIGGIDPGEANVIGGNQFEGVTASDEGSDDNTIISNIVGATGVLTSSAVSRDLEDDMPRRSALPNGSAGVFLSKGTKGTMVGGPTTASSNAIAFNGGNGVEVRDTKTRRNAMRGNRIKKNKSGIALIDGANDGLKAPISEEFKTSASTTATKMKVSARGSVSGNEGVVELFSDDGDQGETFVTRCAVTGGKWNADFEAFSSKKVTATYTDASGNTSAFVIVGDVVGGGGGSGPGTNLDSDGDGFSDELEVALGTSPTDATSTPLEGAPMGTPSALSLTSIQIKLNFLKPAADSIKIAGTLPAPDGFVLAGAKVSTSVGGAAKAFTLDAKGGGISGLTKFKLAKPKLGLAKFTATYAKETFSQLSDEGLTGTENVLLQNRTVKVLVIFNGTVYATDRTVLYSAKQGKTGSAK